MSATAPPDRRPDRPTYWWIQYLRGIAASAVVIFHVYDNSPFPTGRSFWIGAHGVDVFFVISGFIMYSAARDERFVQFISRRMIRIFPLYWLATAWVLVFTYASFRVHPSGTEAVLSLGLIPHYSEAHPAEIWPILVPGWTLSYELLFYALFALGIAARRVVAVPVLAIGLLVTVGYLFKPHAALLAVATSPLLVEFLLGLLIAMVLHRRAGLMPAIVAITLAVTLAAAGQGSTRIALFAGSAAIVSGALWLETHTRAAPITALRLLGDASYSIYLFHTPFLGLFDGVIGARLGALSPHAANAYAGAAVVLSLIVGILFHLLLEKPLMRVLNGWNTRMLRRFEPAPAAI